MRKPTPVFAALLVACATALAACAPTSPTTSPSNGHKCPGPTPGAPERTCSAAEYEQSERRKKLVDNAETIYVEIVAERSRLYNEGGTDTITDVLAERTAGDYQMKIMALLKHRKEEGGHSVGTMTVINSREVPSPEDALVALESCTDGRSFENYDKEGVLVSRGALVQSTSFFTMSEGKLKVFRGTSKEVDECLV